MIASALSPVVWGVGLFVVVVDAMKELSLRSEERGSALLEFAFVALLFYLLAAGTLSLGQATFTIQALQDAARVAARELAVLPLPAELVPLEVLVGSRDPVTAPQLAAANLVKERVFNPDCLVVDLDAVDFETECPVVNQALRPVMIFDNSQNVRLLRYPGALLTDPSNPLSGFSVGIPVVRGRTAEGVEAIDWIPVFEEIQSEDRPDPFLLSGGGLVALRINYPFQSAMLSAFLTDDPSSFDPTIGRVAVASDSEVSVVDDDGFTPSGTAIDDAGVGPYRGQFGLGKQYAFGKEVRPFRRLFSLQALFRREVFVQ